MPEHIQFYLTVNFIWLEGLKTECINKKKKLFYYGNNSIDCILRLLLTSVDFKSKLIREGFMALVVCLT